MELINDFVIMLFAKYLCYFKSSESNVENMYWCTKDFNKGNAISSIVKTKIILKLYFSHLWNISHKVMTFIFLQSIMDGIIIHKAYIATLMFIFLERFANPVLLPPKTIKYHIRISFLSTTHMCNRVKV
jgi:hypothetical protein